MLLFSHDRVAVRLGNQFAVAERMDKWGRISLRDELKRSSVCIDLVPSLDGEAENFPPIVDQQNVERVSQ